MKIDHTKHTLDDIKEALHAKLKQCTLDECTEYSIVVTSNGMDSSCVTVGADYVRQNGIVAYNLRGERV